MFDIETAGQLVLLVLGFDRQNRWPVHHRSGKQLGASKAFAGEVRIGREKMGYHPSDYYKMVWGGFTGHLGYVSREHQLFATALANVPLDEEIGFLCGAAELKILYDLAIAMAMHSPQAQRWEDLGLAVFTLIEAQRAGEVTGELVGNVLAARAEMLDDGLPPEPLGGEVTVSDDVEEPGEVDIPTVEGDYICHTDGRPPEPLN